MAVVAYFITHNEGIESGVMSNEGENKVLYDLFEVDGDIKMFNDPGEAHAWIQEKLDDGEDG